MSTHQDGARRLGIDNGLARNKLSDDAEHERSRGTHQQPKRRDRSARCARLELSIAKAIAYSVRLRLLSVAEVVLAINRTEQVSNYQMDSMVRRRGGGEEENEEERAKGGWIGLHALQCCSYVSKAFG